MFQTIASFAAGAYPTHNFYHFSDTTAQPGKVTYYRLVQVDVDGHRTYYGTCISCAQTVAVNSRGQYAISGIPVDTLVPLYDGDGNIKGVDTIGVSFLIWAWRQGYIEDMHWTTVARDTKNRLDFTLQQIY